MPEIKFDRSTDEALQQIKDRDYAGKYQLDSRPIVSIAINFSSMTRNIVDWEMA